MVVAAVEYIVHLSLFSSDPWPFPRSCPSSFRLAEWQIKFVSYKRETNASLESEENANGEGHAFLFVLASLLFVPLASPLFVSPRFSVHLLDSYNFTVGLVLERLSPPSPRIPPSPTARLLFYIKIGALKTRRYTKSTPWPPRRRRLRPLFVLSVPPGPSCPPSTPSRPADLFLLGSIR